FTNYPTFFRQVNTNGMPVGSASKTVWYAGDTSQISPCCGGFGLMENPPASRSGPWPQGSMFAVYIGNYQGPMRFGADLEWAANLYAMPEPVMDVYGAIKWDQSSATLSVVFNGMNLASGPPAVGASIVTQSRISLGEAGDTNHVQNLFYEGFIVN